MPTPARTIDAICSKRNPAFFGFIVLLNWSGGAAGACFTGAWEGLAGRVCADGRISGLGPEAGLAVGADLV